jgi:ATP-dependent Clp protease ATP-binding subunit ClpC
LDRVRSTGNNELRGVSDVGGETRVQPRRTPGAEQAIADAQDLAGNAPLGTHHLLEALIRSEDSRAAKVLGSLGIDADTLAARIDEVDGAAVVLRDPTTIDLIRAIVEATALRSSDEGGEPGPVEGDPITGRVAGDDPAIGSMVGLWLAIVNGLEDLRARVAPAFGGSQREPSRPSIVRQAIQSRLARRRRGR